MRWTILIILVACNDRIELATARSGFVTPHDSALEPDAPLRLVGVVTAAESVDITPRIAGVISKVNVAAGDAVSKEQVVVEMDPATLQEELRAAEAAVGAATAARLQAMVDIEDAIRTVKAETTAVGLGVSPTNALDDAKFKLKRAEAAFQKAASTQAAEASRARTATDHVSKSILRAPFAGTVARRMRDAGNRVEAGMPIIRIASTGGMRLRFAVPPSLAKVAVVGAKVVASIDTLPTPLVATIKQVTPSVDAASGMIVIEAQFGTDSLADQLRPGLAAWVTP